MNKEDHKIFQIYLQDIRINYNLQLNNSYPEFNLHKSKMNNIKLVLNNK